MTAEASRKQDACLSHKGVYWPTLNVFSAESGGH